MSQLKWYESPLFVGIVSATASVVLQGITLGYLISTYKSTNALSKKEKWQNYVSDTVIETMSEEEKHFLQFIVSPSDVKKTTMDDIGGHTEIIKQIETIFTDQKLPKELDIHLDDNIPKGILFYGPPGTGKTMMCKAIANKYNRICVHIQPSDLIHKYLGESEKNVKNLWGMLLKLKKPCILLIDEIDAIFSSETEKTTTIYSSRYDKSFQLEFLQHWDGFVKNANVTVIGTTNNHETLSPAINRRMPIRIKFELPTEQERKAIIEKVCLFNNNNCVKFDISIKDLVALTEGYSGSEIRDLCFSAAKNSKMTVFETFNKLKKWPEKRVITKQDFLHAKKYIAAANTRSSSSACATEYQTMYM